MKAVVCPSDPPSSNEGLVRCWDHGGKKAPSSQLSSGIAVAEESCLAQGHAWAGWPHPMTILGGTSPLPLAQKDHPNFTVPVR